MSVDYGEQITRCEQYQRSSQRAAYLFCSGLIGSVLTGVYLVIAQQTFTVIGLMGIVALNCALSIANSMSYYRHWQERAIYWKLKLDEDAEFITRFKR